MTHNTGNDSWNRRKRSSKGFVIGGHRYSRKTFPAQHPRV